MGESGGGDLDVLVLAYAGSAELDVASFAGLEDVAGLGADEQLFLVDLNINEVLLLLFIVVLDCEVGHRANDVVLGGRVVSGAGTGFNSGVVPCAHVSGHGEGVEVVVGLGGNVGGKLGFVSFGDVGDDVLEHLLLGGRPCETRLGLG